MGGGANGALKAKDSQVSLEMEMDQLMHVCLLGFSGNSHQRVEEIMGMPLDVFPLRMLCGTAS